MENKPVGTLATIQKRKHSLKYQLLRGLFVVTTILAMAVLAYVIITKLTTTNSSDTPKAEGVLTVSDLGRAGVEIDSESSDASITNLTNELKAKIEKQIANNENPIDTVEILIGVLCNATNASRQNQCSEYIIDFLDNHMGALKLSSDTYGQPDELQITYWRAQFYADLANNYKFIMDNKFAGADGKARDTTTEQLKYVKLYLAIAQNSANWGDAQVSSADGHTWYYYEYKYTDDFTKRLTQLDTKGAL